MAKKFMFVSFIISFIVLFTSIVSASDVAVWQGQYYTGTTFNTGTYDFNFSVYDALVGGGVLFKYYNFNDGKFWGMEN